MNTLSEFYERTFDKSCPEFHIKASAAKLFPEMEIVPEQEVFYICSPNNNKGFVIVSADKRMPSILGYSDKNDFDYENTPPNVKYWLKSYVTSIMNIAEQDVNEISSFQSEIRPEGLPPLLGDIQWGQGDPYNRKCPSYHNKKCVTGCVATAMAQVMKYYSYPTKGKGHKSYWTETNKIHITEDLSDVTFDWDRMLSQYTNSFSEDEADAIATLMYSCGVSVEMDYDPDGSGAYQSDLLHAYINNFGYDGDAAIIFRDYCNNSDWHHLLIQELNEGRPVNYGGANSIDGGHSFVFDGYQISSTNVYPDYHINWGWEGRCDGYYQIASLRPTEQGQYATYLPFSESQQMTIGIQPEDSKDNGKTYICSSNLRASTPIVKQGEKTKVYTSTIFNVSYREFTGILMAALYNQNGDFVTYVGSKDIQELGFLDEIRNMSLDIAIPDNVDEGVYTIKLLCKRVDSDLYNGVCSATYPSLTISDEGAGHMDNEEHSIIGCSEAEFLYAQESTDIYVKLYEIISLKEKPFVGDIYMVLANLDGSTLDIVSEKKQIEELRNNEVMHNPLALHGKISNKWPNGEYKISFASKHVDEETPSYIMYYDWIRLGGIPSDMYYDARIVDGQIQVDGHVYDCISTGLQELTNIGDFGINTVYALCGVRQKVLKSGFNIVRMSDGTTKKVVVK